jgi:putative membrane protein
MMNIQHWLIGTLSILITAYLIPGVQVTFVGALVLAVVLALINILIKPVLFFLTLPINILSLGLFSLVLNALLVMLADKIVPGFSISGFWIALLFSIVLSLINGLFGGTPRR